MCPLVQVNAENVPGKLAGNTSLFMSMPEFLDIRTMILAGIPSGKAVEVSLTAEQTALVKGKKPLEGFRRSLLKMMSQKEHAYDCFVRGTILYVVGTPEPPHKNGVPAKKTRQKKAGSALGKKH